MRNTTKVILALAAIFVSTLAFSAKDPVIDISIVNNTDRTGKIFVDDSAQTMGPLVERKGGSVKWSYKSPDGDWTLFGLALASGMGFYCLGENGNLVLIPQNYKGDTITITLNNFKDGLQCTCTGSACDVSRSIAKKTKSS